MDDFTQVLLADGEWYTAENLVIEGDKFTFQGEPEYLEGTSKAQLMRCKTFRGPVSSIQVTMDVSYRSWERCDVCGVKYDTLDKRVDNQVCDVCTKEINAWEKSPEGQQVCRELGV